MDLKPRRHIPAIPDPRGQSRLVTSHLNWAERRTASHSSILPENPSFGSDPKLHLSVKAMADSCNVPSWGHCQTLKAFRIHKEGPS